MEIISKSFQNNFISHLTTSETETKLFQPLFKRILKLFQNYFSDTEHVGKYS